MLEKIRGVILYKGKSELDGKKIVGIATFNSHNVKTGNMIQSWILRDNGKPPYENLNNADASICGDCIHREGSCYVNLAQGQNQVYKAYQRGLYPNYEELKHSSLFKDKVFRLGSYGDPVAIPFEVWEKIIKLVKNWTGYTHQWKQLRFNAFRLFCMASIETEDQIKEANRLGFRTFRVKASNQVRTANEFVCPASIEAGHSKTCIECKACRGWLLNTPKATNVVINAHGWGWKIKRYEDNITKLKNLVSLPVADVNGFEIK